MAEREQMFKLYETPTIWKIAIFKFMREKLICQSVQSQEHHLELLILFSELDNFISNVSYLRCY